MLYFWKDNRVVTYPEHLFTYETLKLGYSELYCVDTGSKEPQLRYGMYMAHGAWNPIPFDMFPVEFKTHLLLLGIT